MLIPTAQIGPPFIPAGSELRPFLPELWLIATIIAVLIVPFFVRRTGPACAAAALIGTLFALISLLWVGLDPASIGPHFRGFLIFDSVAFYWKLILLLFLAGIILLSINTSVFAFQSTDGPEFFTLLLCASLGMCLMPATSNLLMIFMAVELASLPSYVLAGFRKTRRLGAEAALKYVLFGAACSSIMAYGLSLLFGLSGSLQFPDVLRAPGLLLAIALTCLLVGVGFKISMVPLHFWCPDVFEGAGIDVTAFLSVASKGAGLLLLLRLANTVAVDCGFALRPPLTTLCLTLAVAGALTATVGNTAAFVQTNIKRLLAYSSIAQAGYMLCAASLLIKTPANSSLAASALLLYLFIYALMNLGAFSVAAVVSRHGGGERIENFRGLSRRSPILAGCMFCCLISLIGLPPFAGFWAKMNLLWAFFQLGSWWWLLIIVIAVNTILSAFYYFRILQAMYLEPSDAPKVSGSPVAFVLSVLCTVALIVLFFAFNPLLRYSIAHSHLFAASPMLVQR